MNGDSLRDWEITLQEEEEGLKGELEDDPRPWKVAEFNSAIAECKRKIAELKGTSQ